MPGKEQRFRRTKFAPEVIRAAVDLFWGHLDERAREHTHHTRTVFVTNDEVWHFDTDDEFHAEYRRDPVRAEYSVSWVEGSRFRTELTYPDSIVDVRLPKREQVVNVFDIFEAHRGESIIEIPAVKPTVFIGHGANDQWRLLGEYLNTRHGLDIDAFELKPRAGYTAKEVLERMVAEASFACLVHTAEDEQATDAMRARQNVVHETGLFQARLGFPRAIILREDGCEDFSNVDGVQEIRFAKGNIREAFGEVIGTIRREFPKAQDPEQIPLGAGSGRRKRIACAG